MIILVNTCAPKPPDHEAVLYNFTNIFARLSIARRMTHLPKCVTNNNNNNNWFLYSAFLV